MKQRFEIVHDRRVPLSASEILRAIAIHCGITPTVSEIGDSPELLMESDLRSRRFVGPNDSYAP